MKEAEEKEHRRREIMEKDRTERIRKIKEREEFRQKAVHDKRRQIQVYPRFPAEKKVETLSFSALTSVLVAGVCRRAE